MRRNWEEEGKKIYKHIFLFLTCDEDESFVVLSDSFEGLEINTIANCDRSSLGSSALLGTDNGAVLDSVESQGWLSIIEINKFKN